MNYQLSANKLRLDRDAIVNEMAEKQYTNGGAKKDARTRPSFIDDTRYHLNILAESLEVESKELFLNHIDWAKSMLESRNVTSDMLKNNLKQLGDVISMRYRDEIVKPVLEYTGSALNHLSQFNHPTKSFIDRENPLYEQASQYLNHLLNARRKEAVDIIDNLIQNDVHVRDIYEYIFQTSQYEVGRLWQLNKITVAHEHYCTAATQTIMSGLYSHIFSMDRTGKVMVSCSVSNELHEIGIRMVSDYFEMEGWDTYYMGANTPADDIIAAIKENRADLLSISVTIPTFLDQARKLISKIRQHPDLKKTIILAGGYPFIVAPDLYKKIGADGTAKSAKESVEIARKLLDQKQS